MGFLARTLVAVASALYFLPSIAALTFGFPYGSQKVRGVNLGGWLVLEVGYDTNLLLLVEASNPLSHFPKPWITPSLFDGTGNTGIVDEWTFGQFQDRTTALNKLQNHWNTWITESDFAAIAAAGCVLVTGCFCTLFLTIFDAYEGLIM